MEFKWVDINDINEEMFALPIDKVVAKIMKGKERIEGRRFEGEGRKGLEEGKMKEWTPSTYQVFLTCEVWGKGEKN